MLQIREGDLGGALALEGADLPQFSPEKFFPRVAEQILHEWVGVHDLTRFSIENQNAVHRGLIEPPVAELGIAYRLLASRLGLFRSQFRLLGACLVGPALGLLGPYFRLLGAQLGLFGTRLRLFRAGFRLLRPGPRLGQAGRRPLASSALKSFMWILLSCCDS